MPPITLHWTEHRHSQEFDFGGGSPLGEALGCKFLRNLTLGGNFRKFSLTVNITDRLVTTMDLNENMQEYIRLLNIHYCSLHV